MDDDDDDGSTTVVAIEYLVMQEQKKEWENYVVSLARKILLPNAEDVDADDAVVGGAPSLIPKQWQSLDVTYQPPHVERIYTVLDEQSEFYPFPGGTRRLRVSLHLIHECAMEDALFHPHPWQSAFVILDGAYEMRHGYSSTLDAPVEFTQMSHSRNHLPNYAMTFRDEWHAVAPTGKRVLSIMINGEPYSDPPRQMPIVPPRQPRLPRDRIEHLLGEFRAALA